MNRFIYTLLSFLAIAAAGCSKADELLYNDIARIQLNDTSAINSTFVYETAAVSRDTVYIPVNTIGDLSNVDRTVKLVQVAETGVVDAAVAGVHYLAFDDPSIQPLMVVKANAVKAQIPVVLLRDPSLKEKTVRLRLELVANAQFGLGELRQRALTLVFSDRLERFYSWRVDGTQASAYNAFGKYSTVKHQFMIDILGEKIDEAWYQMALSIAATTHYKNLLKQRLADFNADPANIASGKAPLKESAAVGATIITFP
ncbi:DUF4843 domain-containing protein [Pedobacter sp. GR22-6]|uniref:DUF4843 domain-containing protein n=1 Tax=Pedobacter sp. GR22-6 TaxID=3127957 RepID=UPI00307DBC9A